MKLLRATWTRPPNFAVHADAVSRRGAQLRDEYISRAFSARMFAMPNYALERAGMGRGWRAARVERDFTLAARWNGFARPAQRGRWASPSER
jgi:hypothetical protein